MIRKPVNSLEKCVQHVANNISRQWSNWSKLNNYQVGTITAVKQTIAHREQMSLFSQVARELNVDCISWESFKWSQIRETIILFPLYPNKIKRENSFSFLFQKP